MKKKGKGIFHVFVNYTVREYNTYTSATYHFSGKADEEDKLKACGCVCSGLLDHLGIQHDINFMYDPNGNLEELANE